MDLWIRSQDKEYLTKVEQLEIREQDDHYKICAINFQNTYGYNFINLGDYKSKERALEVLDEIQNILKPKMILNCNWEPGIVDGKLENIPVNESIEFEHMPSVNVYEMPEE